MSIIHAVFADDVQAGDAVDRLQLAGLLGTDMRRVKEGPADAVRTRLVVTSDAPDDQIRGILEESGASTITVTDAAAAQASRLRFEPGSTANPGQQSRSQRQIQSGRIPPEAKIPGTALLWGNLARDDDE